MLIINEALSSLEPSEQDALLQAIIDDRPDGGLIWIDREREGLDSFDRVYLMRSGRVVQERTGDGGPVAGVEAANTSPRTAPTSSFTDDVQVLDDVPMLRGLSAETLKLIAFTCDRLTFNDGETLFRQGDSADEAFIIIDGSAEMIITDGQEERVIDTQGPGTLIGDVALLSNTSRIATMRSAGDLSVLRLSREQLFDLVHKDANLDLAVMRGLSDRLVNTAEKLESSKSAA